MRGVSTPGVFLHAMTSFRLYSVFPQEEWIFQELRKDTPVYRAWLVSAS
jgi:hypothetical protein